MNVRTLSLILCSLATPALWAQDVVHFDNGDRLSGRIKTLSRGEVVFSTPLVDGDISIGWSRIERIDSDRVFQFQTRTGSRFLGKILAGEGQDAGPSEIRVATSTGERTIRQEDVVVATQTVRKLPGLLTANIGTGLTLSKSNDQKQFNTNAAVNYRSPKYLAAATASSIFSTQQDAANTNRHELTLTFSRQIKPRWSATALADFLNSEEQQLDLRTLFGGGPTRMWVTNSHIILYSTMGAVWNREKYNSSSGSLPPDNQVEGLATAGLEYFQFRMWQVNTEFRLFPSITDGGRIRADWTAGVHLRLRHGKPLWWTFNQTFNFDSRPPSGAPGTDYTTSSSLSWSFP